MRPTPPEAPRAEPEIIPPDRASERVSGVHPRISVSFTSAQGARVRSSSPLALALGVIGVVLVVALVLMLLLGALLVAVPIAAALIGGAIIAAIARAYFRKPS
jgi:hypothetical protein